MPDTLYLAYNRRPGYRIDFGLVHLWRQCNRYLHFRHKWSIFNL